MVNALWHSELSIPVVTVSSQHSVKQVTSIVIDHPRAVEVALQHLVKLGHRKIAFIKGQAFVPDAEVQWKAIVDVARQMGLPISLKLVTQTKDNSPSPECGYKLTQRLLASGEPFTAWFAFNDISAIGSIRALHEAGRRVPEEVSVVGFDDIESAAYQSPGLTTVRQPLRKMGRIAAQVVLRRIERTNQKSDGQPFQLVVEPELIGRGTTAAMHEHKRTGNKILAYDS